eukprot:190013_1
MTTTAEDCMVLDFDDDIPFKTEPENKLEAIFDLLLKIYHNPNCDFQDEDNEFQPLKVTADDLNITGSDIQNVRTIHGKQLISIWNGDMQRDKNILAVLAIAQKLDVPYLTYLTDLYNRDRVATWMNNDSTQSFLTEMDWMNKNKHCAELKNLSASSVETVKHGILSFFHRVVPKMQLRLSNRIIDKLEDTLHYIKAQVDFVHKMAHEKGTACPFQIDACIVYDKVQSTPQKNKSIRLPDDPDDDEDDDDDPDDEEDDAEADVAFEDLIGNVKNRLNNEKLLHEIGVMKRAETDEKDEKSDGDNGYRYMRGYGECFDKFRVNLMETKGDKFAEYPRNHRLCSLIDRRQPKEENKKYVRKEDEIIFYEPPKDCNRIPNQEEAEVDLWYFDSSKTCILPNTGYGKQVKKSVELNITSGTGANGALLVLSFHVLSADQIRAYLYWNGGVMRFFAEDVLCLLPSFFVDNKENKAFRQSAAAQSIASDIKTKLRDKKFEAFYKEYGATR